MQERKRMDPNSTGVKLIMAGMAELVDEGNTPHEVFEIVNDIEQNIFHALAEIHAENKEKSSRS